MSDWEEELEDLNKETFIEFIKNQFTSFKNGEQYLYYDYDTYQLLEWRVILNICEDFNLIISEVDLSGSASDVITSYINLNKFIQPFLKEEINDSKDTKTC